MSAIRASSCPGSVEDPRQGPGHAVEPVLAGLAEQPQVVDRPQPHRVGEDVRRRHRVPSDAAVPAVRGVTFQLLSRMTCLTCATRPMTFFHSV